MKKIFILLCIMNFVCNVYGANHTDDGFLPLVELKQKISQEEVNVDFFKKLNKEIMGIEKPHKFVKKYKDYLQSYKKIEESLSNQNIECKNFFPEENFTLLFLHLSTDCKSESCQKSKEKYLLISKDFEIISEVSDLFKKIDEEAEKIKNNNAFKILEMFKKSKL